MIRLALAGVADHRHRLFVHPVRRRRAGVRAVGFSEPDAPARSDFTLQHAIPAFADHHDLIATTAPSLMAIAAPAGDTAGIILDSLAAGADVIVAPPVGASSGDLDALLGTATESGRRLAVVHTYRHHPAVRLAREMIIQGRLGRLRHLVLDAAESVPEPELAAATREVLDLFRWFTGVRSGTVTGPDAADVRQTGDPDEQVIMTVLGQGPAGDCRGEVVRTRGPAQTPFLVQLTGDRGALTWEVATGSFRSVIDGRPSPVIAAGLPGDPAAWVLTDLIRQPSPSTPAEELWPTRIGMLARESAEQGVPIDWQL